MKREISENLLSFLSVFKSTPHVPYFVLRTSSDLPKCELIQVSVGVRRGRCLVRTCSSAFVPRTEFVDAGCDSQVRHEVKLFKIVGGETEEDSRWQIDDPFGCFLGYMRFKGLQTTRFTCGMK